MQVAAFIMCVLLIHIKVSKSSTKIKTENVNSSAKKKEINSVCRCIELSEIKTSVPEKLTSNDAGRTRTSAYGNANQETNQQHGQRFQKDVPPFFYNVGYVLQEITKRADVPDPKSEYKHEADKNGRFPSDLVDRNFAVHNNDSPAELTLYSRNISNLDSGFIQDRNSVSLGYQRGVLTENYQSENTPTSLHPTDVKGSNNHPINMNSLNETNNEHTISTLSETNNEHTISTLNSTPLLHVYSNSSKRLAREGTLSLSERVTLSSDVTKIKSGPSETRNHTGTSIELQELQRSSISTDDSTKVSTTPIYQLRLGIRVASGNKNNRTRLPLNETNTPFTSREEISLNYSVPRTTNERGEKVNFAKTVIKDDLPRFPRLRSRGGTKTIHITEKNYDQVTTKILPGCKVHKTDPKRPQSNDNYTLQKYPTRESYLRTSKLSIVPNETALSIQVNSITGGINSEKVDSTILHNNKTVETVRKPTPHVTSLSETDSLSNYLNRITRAYTAPWQTEKSPSGIYKGIIANMSVPQAETEKYKTTVNSNIEMNIQYVPLNGDSNNTVSLVPLSQVLSLKNMNETQIENKSLRRKHSLLSLRRTHTFRKNDRTFPKFATAPHHIISTSVNFSGRNRETHFLNKPSLLSRLVDDKLFKDNYTAAKGVTNGHQIDRISFNGGKLHRHNIGYQANKVPKMYELNPPFKIVYKRPARNQSSNELYLALNDRNEHKATTESSIRFKSQPGIREISRSKKMVSQISSLKVEDTGSQSTHSSSSRKRKTLTSLSRPQNQKINYTQSGIARTTESNIYNHSRYKVFSSSNNITNVQTRSKITSNCTEVSGNENTQHSNNTVTERRISGSINEQLHNIRTPIPYSAPVYNRTQEYKSVIAEMRNKTELMKIRNNSAIEKNGALEEETKISGTLPQYSRIDVTVPAKYNYHKIVLNKSHYDFQENTRNARTENSSVENDNPNTANISAKMYTVQSHTYSITKVHDDVNKKKFASQPNEVMKNQNSNETFRKEYTISLVNNSWAMPTEATLEPTSLVTANDRDLQKFSNPSVFKYLEVDSSTNSESLGNLSQSVNPLLDITSKISSRDTYSHTSARSVSAEICEGSCVRGTPITEDLHKEKETKTLFGRAIKLQSDFTTSKRPNLFALRSVTSDESTQDSLSAANKTDAIASTHVSVTESDEMLVTNTVAVLVISQISITTEANKVQNSSSKRERINSANKGHRDYSSQENDTQTESNSYTETSMKLQQILQENDTSLESNSSEEASVKSQQTHQKNDTLPESKSSEQSSVKLHQLRQENDSPSKSKSSEEASVKLHQTHQKNETLHESNSSEEASVKSQQTLQENNTLSESNSSEEASVKLHQTHQKNETLHESNSSEEASVKSQQTLQENNTPSESNSSEEASVKLPQTHQNNTASESNSFEEASMKLHRTRQENNTPSESHSSEEVAIMLQQTRQKNNTHPEENSSEGFTVQLHKKRHENIPLSESNSFEKVTETPQHTRLNSSQSPSGIVSREEGCDDCSEENDACSESASSEEVVEKPPRTLIISNVPLVPYLLNAVASVNSTMDDDAGRQETNFKGNVMPNFKVYSAFPLWIGQQPASYQFPLYGNKVDSSYKPDSRNNEHSNGNKEEFEMASKVSRNSFPYTSSDVELRSFLRKYDNRENSNEQYEISPVRRYHKNYDSSYHQYKHT